MSSTVHIPKQRGSRRNRLALDHREVQMTWVMLAIRRRECCVDPERRLVGSLALASSFVALLRLLDSTLMHCTLLGVLLRFLPSPPAHPLSFFSLLPISFFLYRPSPLLFLLLPLPLLLLTFHLLLGFPLSLLLCLLLSILLSLLLGLLLSQLLLPSLVELRSNLFTYVISNQSLLL